MINRFLFTAAVLIVASLPCSARRMVELEGCKKIDAFASVVTQIQERPWNDLSLEWIQSIWPTQLVPFDCTAAKCRSYVHNGRVIDDYVACGEKVDLDLSGRDLNRSLVVTLTYSNRQKAEVFNAVRKFALAAGVPKSELGRLNS